MARQKLTPSIAFQSAFTLQQEGEPINGHTLWLKVGKVGSLTTAKKWADLWNALERGEEAPRIEYRHVYEAVKQGETVEDRDLIEEIPLEIQDTTNAFLTQIYSQIQSLFEEEAQETRELCSSWVEEAKTKAREAIAQREEALLHFTQVQQQLLEREQQLQVIQEKVTVQGTTITELRSQLKSKDAERSILELQRLELSQRLGQVEEQLNQFITDRERVQRECSQLQEREERLITKLNLLRERDDESRQIATGREKENALLTAKIEAFEYQFERNEKRITELESYTRELSAQLAEKEGRARAAEERARQWEERAKAGQAPSKVNKRPQSPEGKAK